MNQQAKDGRAVRAILRNATASAHRRLDDRLAVHDVATLRGYTDYLAAVAPALLSLEQALAEAGIADLLADWPRRRRGEAILADLRQLGAGPGPLPHAGWIHDEATMLGAAYTLEGSRLGGALLHRRAAAALDPRVAASRFLAHGQDQPLWPGFLAVLDAWRPEADEQARASHSAVLSFALFERAAGGG